MREKNKQWWWEGSVWGLHPSETVGDDGWRDSNAYYFSSIIPPEVVTSVYQEVMRKGMGGRM